MNAQTVTRNKMAEKIAAWIWICFDTLGITATILAFINIDGIEKAILFVASLVFLGYRIYHLHLDAKKKEIDYKEKHFDLTKKINQKK